MGLSGTVSRTSTNCFAVLLGVLTGEPVGGVVTTLQSWLRVRGSNPRPTGYSWRLQIRTGLMPLSPTASRYYH